MWTLEALKSDYRVALLAGGRIDLAALNQSYGTSVEPFECETVAIPLPWPLANADWGAALRGAFLWRSMRKFFKHYDVLINSYNLGEFDRPGIHFLADFSWDEDLRRNAEPIPRGLRGIVHLNAPIRRGYLALARALAGPKLQGSESEIGLVIANYHWTRNVLRRRHGIESRVLYPPVSVCEPPGARARRRGRFICLGRISPEKRIERIVEILKAVRSRGHQVELHIVGDTRETVYGQKVERSCRHEGDWIVLYGRQLGQNKARLLSESDFGIHARVEEPFGIAVAEMVAAGCLPFVPAVGGPAEIVEHNPYLTFNTVDDAVMKIDAMLTNPDLERETRAAILRRARDFSTESFKGGIRSVVSEFLESQYPAPTFASG